MNKHKQPLFSITLDRKPQGYISTLKRLTFTLGNFELIFEFAWLFTHWRYCAKCGDILHDDGCSNPRCETRQLPPTN